MTKQMYVFLEHGDIINQNDEWMERAGIWLRSFCTGQTYNISDHGLMRREVPQPIAPDTVCAQLRQVGDVAMTTGGLTKREWFAGMALKGFLNFMSCMPDGEQDYSYIASHCYDIADAMLKAGKETE